MRILPYLGVMIIIGIVLMVILYLAIYSIFLLNQEVKKTFYSNGETSLFLFIKSFLSIFPMFLLMMFLSTVVSDFVKISPSSLIIFLISSFLGLASVLFLVHSLHHKNLKRTFKSLFMGGMVFLFFAPSIYFTLEPIVVKIKGRYNRIEEHHKFYESIEKDNIVFIDFISKELNQTFPKESKIVSLSTNNDYNYMAIELLTAPKFIEMLTRKRRLSYEKIIDKKDNGGYDVLLSSGYRDKSTIQFLCYY